MAIRKPLGHLADLSEHLVTISRPLANINEPYSTDDVKVAKVTKTSPDAFGNCRKHVK
jgi:hypothetical protein